jgi:hypothetical protein
MAGLAQAYLPHQETNSTLPELKTNQLPQNFVKISNMRYPDAVFKTVKGILTFKARVKCPTPDSHLFHLSSCTSLIDGGKAQSYMSILSNITVLLSKGSNRYI